MILSEPLTCVSPILVQIYILSRNRPLFLRECLLSARRLIVPSQHLLEIIVSENSSTDSAAAMVEQEFPEIELRRRVPDVSSSEHLDVVISELCADYSILFHDDDIFEPDYLVHVLAGFHAYPEASAIGCNAVLMTEKGDSYGRLNSYKSNLLITHARQCLLHYLPSSAHEQGVAAFPSYCYKKGSLTSVCISEIRHVGRCGDVFLLLEVLKSGPLIWLARPLIRYRVHGGSDSRGLGISDYQPLWRRMKQEKISWFHPGFLRHRYFEWHKYCRMHQQVKAKQVKSAKGRSSWESIRLLSLLYLVILKVKIRLIAYLCALFRQ